MSDSHMMQLIERQTAPSTSSKAFVVVPDQNWDGNDGSWSTFIIQSNESKSPGAANPAAANGFQFNQSSTWSLYGNHTLQGSSQLPVSGSGLYGADLVTVGPSSNAALAPGLATTVAGITTEPYYLGRLGLQPSSSSRFNDSQGVLGSLTLGGYDQSRFVQNDVTFNIDQGNAKALRAGIRSIVASGTLVGNVNLLSENVTAIIDSDLPYLYLPNAACKKFETAFGLSWDADRQLYLLNDTIHGTLRTANPSISFNLGPSATQTTNVTLPYLAFDLQVTQPIAENGTNYFPLRCTSNSSQYVLGRAFLQETYLLVDYETSNFSISQAQFSNQSEIVTIDHSSSNPTSGDESAGSGGAAFSTGAIAGIAIGASVAVVLLLSLLVVLFRRSRRQCHDHPKGPPSISGPIPFDSTKDSWPNSPTSSGDHNTQPPMSALSNNETPFQRFEERLERLERANTTHLPPYSNTWEGGPELRSEVSGENIPTQLRFAAANNARDRPKQELAGSPAARELQDAHLSGRLQPKPVKHVFELAADDSRRTSRRR
ncbi:MAG: hypothetical protein Q9222_005467 [Ikaeria aurantiellina]